MGDPMDDPRQVAKMVGDAIGKPDMADDIMSGRMNAAEICPMAMGMVDGLVRNMLIPIVGATGVTVDINNMRLLVAMLDGSVMEIAFKEVQA